MKSVEIAVSMLKQMLSNMKVEQILGEKTLCLSVP